MYRFMYRYEKNSNSVSIRYDLKRTEESESTPTYWIPKINYSGYGDSLLNTPSECLGG